MIRKFPIDRIILDTMTVLFVLFCALFAIESLQEKAQKVNKAIDIASPNGRILVELEWNPESDSDIDMWVKAPKDEMPVGYSRTSDKMSSYERDDKGKTNDFSHFNYEVTTIRNLVPGIYVVDVHAFALRDEGPTLVKVRASISYLGAAMVIATKELALTAKGQELTAFSFELDENSNLVEGSVHYNYIPLRNQP
jgi:hypothetical protein